MPDRPPANPPRPERGALSDRPLPRLLVDLYRARTSGALELVREHTRKRLLLRDGFLVAAESNLDSESLAALLLSAGTLTRRQHTELISLARTKQCGEGAALLALGWIEPKKLFPALLDQLRQRVLDCFSWPAGHYHIDCQASPPDAARALRSHPYGLVLEGLRTRWNVERMLSDLHPQLDKVPTQSEHFGEVAEQLEHTPEIETLCAALDGQQTLGQALCGGANSPELLAAAWLLDASGALCFERRAPVQPEGDPGAVAVEIEVRGQPHPAQSTPSTESSSAQGPVAAGAKKAAPGKRLRSASNTDQAAAAKIREELLERRARLRDLDHYALLGVAPDASTAAIKKAYFLAAKRYHPDALRRLDLTDILTEATEVFSRIGEVYELLSNPVRRREYDAALETGGNDGDADRLARAEMFYRKGEILVRMGDFRGALQYLEPAVELWPDEVEYQSTLGWALHKQCPPEPERARHHLECALELDPEHAESHTRLELVLREQNAKLR